MEPALIEEHLLVCSFPERTDLLGLAPDRKGLLLHTQGNELFEMVGFGVTVARLPHHHRVAGDAQPVGKSRLCQANARSQRHYHLTENIVSHTIRGSLHGNLPSI